MTDRVVGKNGDEAGEEEVAPLPYVQAAPSGGTMTIDRPPHPNEAMEAGLKEAEADGFAVTAEQHPDPGHGWYFYLRDRCIPPHVGTVQPTDVYAIVLAKILRRCPAWRKKQGERKEAR